MKKMFSVLALLMICSLSSVAQYSNEVSLVLQPLKLDKQDSYSLLYRRSLKQKNLYMRATLGLGIVYDKEWRADSVSSNTGDFSYDLGIGIQKNLDLGSLEKIQGYIASDVYYNSSFKRGTNDTYYGYFWNTGLRPLAGLTYKPLNNVKLSIEARSDFNLNLQGYSAPGINRDVRMSFRPMNELVLGIGYLF